MRFLKKVNKIKKMSVLSNQEKNAKKMNNYKS